ncbi:MAG: hypothetical protein JKY34_10660 [Kordiimonadaceae bacterium]|nr:hypothetical protein [Kordiimonadaceae bacterium]
MHSCLRKVRLQAYPDAVAEGKKRLQDIFHSGEIHTVILSNESAFGDPFSDDKAGFFPFLPTALEGIRQIFEGHEVETHFIARNLMHLLPSFYIQRVRQGATYSASHFYARSCRENLSWQPIISALRTQLPSASLELHFFEDLVQKADNALAHTLVPAAMPQGHSMSTSLVQRNRAVGARAISSMLFLNKTAARYAQLRHQPVEPIIEKLRKSLHPVAELFGGTKLRLPETLASALNTQYAADKIALGVKV